jgi:hypothetical protein
MPVWQRLKADATESKPHTLSAPAARWSNGEGIVFEAQV